MLKLSIIIPAYNEEKRDLPQTLIKVRDYLKTKDFQAEVIVVDDGSKDKTMAVSNELIKNWPGFRLISYPQNHGKGYAVKKGILEAKGEWRLFMDADSSTSVTELDKLLKYISGFQIIIGSRYLNDGSIKEKQPLFRRIISRGGNLLIRIILGLKIKDTQCGFKLFSAKAVRDIFPLQTIDRWGFDMEILAIAQKKGYKILEVPVDWYNDIASRVTRGMTFSTLGELFKIRKRIAKQ